MLVSDDLSNKLNQKSKIYELDFTNGSNSSNTKTIKQPIQELELELELRDFMSRLTISLPDNLHNRISSLAMRNKESMSNIINQLIQVGLRHWFESQDKLKANSAVEQHCQQLIIQMNALIKNMSVALLNFNQEDFEKLQQAAVGKYSELQNIHCNMG